MVISPPSMPATASLASAVTHDVTIVTTRKLAQAKVLGVPPEEFGIERGARSIRDCNYCFHEVVTRTEAQLIAEGFDEVQIRSLGDYTGNSDVETLARDTTREHLGPAAGEANPAARLVRITEHYVRMDYEGEGKPCLYQVITGGDQGEVLRKDGRECITPFDAMPFATTTPVPMTHRFFGRSIADLVMPLQREKTALKRGALDNLYLHNNPRVEVSEANAGPNTLDDLLVSRPGGVVRTKTAGGLNWQVVPDITASIYPMMQYLDAELETRTGLSRQSQGIDANALQNQSATAVAQVFSASQMRIKLIARIMAEGVRDIFALLHGTSLDAYATAVQPEIAQFSGTHVLGFFRGPNLEATIESAEQGTDDNRLTIRGFRPVTDAATLYGSVSYRDTPSATAVDGAEVPVNPRTGRCDVRRDTRYSRFKVRIPAATPWTFCAGVVPDLTTGGTL